MATAEVNSAGPQGDQREKMLPPSEEDAPPVSKGTSASLNFSALTPCQFGISAQSFTPAASSSSNRKDKSRLAQMKARRRSGIGVRGSPETNSLIRFMAQERMKTPPSTHRTPEHVRNSPFLPRVASTLRQKMASFQSLMGVEESEASDPMPRQDSYTGGHIKTRDYLSDENSKENHPPMMMPSPGKRRCLGPLEGCEVEIREASAPIRQFKLKEQEDIEELVTQVLTRGPLPSTVIDAKAVLISPPLHVDFEPQACSHTKKQQDCVVELQRPSLPLADDPGTPFVLPSLPSLLEMKPTGENDSAGMSAVKKKKRVHFGGPLSPEFFDKNLPPSTPLQKGATPAQAPTPGGVQFRSLLKTPQRSEPRPTQAQTDLGCPITFGASPTLTMPSHFRMQFEGEDVEEKDGKIVFPSMEEIDSAVTSDTAYVWNPQPLNLDAAFHEECLSQTVTVSETTPSTSSEVCVLDDPASLPEEKRPEVGVEAPTSVRSNNRRKKADPEFESTSEAPARSRSRKRKQPEESEPVKRSTRSAAKLASGKMKTTSTATRQWNRDVDRSLYGSRDYASKDPALSPITERLSFTSQSPAAQHTPSAACTATNPETHSSHEIANDNEATGELTVTQAFENPPEDSITSPDSSKESRRGKGMRLSGQRSRGRGMKKRKVSVADCDLLSEVPLDQTAGKTEEHCEDQTATRLEASRETPLYHTALIRRGVDHELDAKTSAIIPSAKSECDIGLNPCPALGEELTDLNLPAELPQREAEQGTRSAVNSSVLQEQGEQQLNEHQRSHEEEENLHGDQAASQHENSSRSSQEDGGLSDSHLAPWQADFNFEDIFKPVATRGQQSVRRSLRNQSHSNNSAGLAWLPWTSPDSGKEGRRKTRGRRLSAALPVPPSVSEETRDNTS
ncbi:putative cell division cycle-associated protein 2 isoform 2 [Scophthalmus maximus]|uniref:Putative cell division cycle-associated protein 2 isoform 2 n=1 Tax=Scophthalmus maximus TaxID=52904 RepID=A0A2U9BQV7_SCOMX|nr:putative cell division cycle-associated protein 2 isoform 2 [Scophthalmus maximus]